MAIIEIKPYGTGAIAGIESPCRLRVKMERGGLKDANSSAPGAMDYTIASFNNYIRSSMMIKLNGATKVTGVNLTGFTVYEYSSTFGFLGTSSEGDTLRSACRYIKIVKQTSTLPDEVYLSFNGFPEEVYNVQIEKGTSSNRLLSETLVFDVDGEVCTTARLLLPPNYSINGNKVPLIIWCACDGGYANYTTPTNAWDFTIDNLDGMGSTSDYATNQLKYLADEGFAVLNVYPWGSYNFSNYPKCGLSGALPIPVTFRAYEKAVEYVTSRFNISDKNIFQASFSGSGKLSSFYAAHRPNYSLRHIFAFSPVVDGLCFYRWGASFTHSRKAIQHEMQFNLNAGNGSVFCPSSNTDVDWPIHPKNGNDDGKNFILANAGKFAQCTAINWLNLTEQDWEDKWADTKKFGNDWQDVRTLHESQPTAEEWATLYENGVSTIYNNYDLAIIGDGVPITIIGAKDDTGCPYEAMHEFVVQLQNGGMDAELITLPNESTADYGGGHDLNTGHGSPVRHNVKTNIATRYGSTYASVPFGWWYAVNYIYTHYLNNE